MATTERGIYYTAAADDTTVADFNVITKRIADSTESALDQLQAHSDTRSATPFFSGVKTGDWAIAPGVGSLVGFNASLVNPDGLLVPGSVVQMTPGIWQIDASAGLLSPSASAFFRLQLLLGSETLAQSSSGQWLSCSAALRVTSAPPALGLLACNDSGSETITLTWARMSVARIGAV